MKYEEMIKEIEDRREPMLKNYDILHQNDKNDNYWKIIPGLAAKGYVFELGMVINWIGSKYKPKKILEIGTRTGGSLIHLLSVYESYDDLDIHCFDYWQYPPNETPMPKFVYRYLPSLIKGSLFKKYYFNKIEENLNLFNIPFKNINFTSGDSKIKVPSFFKDNPDKKLIIY